jgi:hypothetical protein
MVGRDSDFDAGGVGLRPPVGDATGGLVRPLGAFERVRRAVQHREVSVRCGAHHAVTGCAQEVARSGGAREMNTRGSTFGPSKRGKFSAAVDTSLTTTVFSQRSMWRFAASHRRAAAKGQTFISCTAPCQKALPTTELPSTFVAHVGSQTPCHRLKIDVTAMSPVTRF